MFVDGLKLAALGLTVVFVFLIILTFVIEFSRRLLKPFTEKELRETAAREKKKPVMTDNTVIAVISAAIARHRAGLGLRAGRS